MILVGGNLFALEPLDSKTSQVLREIDPDWIELVHYGCLKEVHRTTWGYFGISLDAAIMLYAKDDESLVQWVCPD